MYYESRSSGESPSGLRQMKWIIAGGLFLFLSPIVGALFLFASVGSIGIAPSPPPAPVSNLGPPVNLGSVSPPQYIVTLDEAVAAAYPQFISCQVSPSILLAQQNVESGFNPQAISPAGAEGISQFEPATFSEYGTPVPPGGASPPSPFNAVDDIWAEARYLCSLGIDTNPINALIAYNCGSISSACVAASSGYAEEIMSSALSISNGVTKKSVLKPILSVG